MVYCGRIHMHKLLVEQGYNQPPRDYLRYKCPNSVNDPKSTTWFLSQNGQLHTLDKLEALSLNICEGFYVFQINYKSEICKLVV